MWAFSRLIHEFNGDFEIAGGAHSVDNDVAKLFPFFRFKRERTKRLCIGRLVATVHAKFHDAPLHHVRGFESESFHAWLLVPILALSGITSVLV